MRVFPPLLLFGFLLKHVLASLCTVTRDPNSGRLIFSTPPITGHDCSIQWLEGIDRKLGDCDEKLRALREEAEGWYNATTLISDKNHTNVTHKRTCMPDGHQLIIKCNNTIVENHEITDHRNATGARIGLGTGFGITAAVVLFVAAVVVVVVFKKCKKKIPACGRFWRPDDNAVTMKELQLGQEETKTLRG